MSPRRPLSAAHELLGAAVRARRSAADVSIAAVAAQAGIAPSRLRLIEAGRADPELGELVALARCLDVPLAELLDGL